ncbi:MAG: phospho-sugar mutase [Oscillospiraceae bacterium]
MTVSERYALWCSTPLEDADLTAELLNIQGNEAEIYERFYTDLTFGTAGLRGILGVGTNRMNVYTVRRATQGLALWIKEKAKIPSAAIAYDSRNKSELFAREAASVLAANGVKVYLYSSLAPTPMLSWAVRCLGCAAGIVVTASHNPAEYNGYKVYGPDGCQMTTESAAAVFTHIEKTDLFRDVLRIPYEEAVQTQDICPVPSGCVEDYDKQVLACRLFPDILPQTDLRVVYTPLNGTGNLHVRRVLRKAGLRDLIVVPEQEMPDGNFPTCRYPNPELSEAMSLGLALAHATDADLLIGTDPDADRVGVAARCENEFTLLTGNEVGVLLTDYIAFSRRSSNTMPDRPVMVKSIVSTSLAQAVAESYGVEMRDVLTGFKYIGEQIGKMESLGEAGRFVFGFEESCGYLAGSYVRDKDAVSASLLIAEMAAYHKRAGKTLFDVLNEIYAKFGCFFNTVTSTAFSGSDGMKKMADLMDTLFSSYPASLGGREVVEVRDYRRGMCIRATKSTPLDVPSSDVISLVLREGATVLIRPSGTEPKLKVYYMCNGKTMQDAKALAASLQTAVNSILGI